MELQITTFYVLCCELLSALNIRKDIQTKMNNAEVMTVVLTAARFFGGNFRTAARFLEEHGYIPDMLSESRLNRRMHALGADIWETLFLIVSEVFKNRNTGKEYILDSFPVPICDNIRISRSKIFQGEEFRGYMPSKRRYFYGIRVHMIITASGESLKPIRKKNSVRAEGDFIFRRALAHTRKKVETAFSGITGLFPKKIHAVTPQGFALKVIGFILVFSIRFL